jgi:hypothetical protein
MIPDKELARVRSRVAAPAFDWGETRITNSRDESTPRTSRPTRKETLPSFSRPEERTPGNRFAGGRNRFTDESPQTPTSNRFIKRRT